MATAAAVGAVGIWPMASLGWVDLHIKPLAFAGVAVGAVLFGIGIVLLGYCPGTGVAACGEGRRDAMVGVLGMFTGAAAYVFFYSTLRSMTKVFGDWGKTTLPSLTGTSAWGWIVILSGTVALAYALDRRRRGSREPTGQRSAPTAQATR